MESPCFDLRLYIEEARQLQLRHFHDSLLIECKSSLALPRLRKEFVCLAHPLQIELRDRDADHCQALIRAQRQRVVEILAGLLKNSLLWEQDLLLGGLDKNVPHGDNSRYVLVVLLQGFFNIASRFGKLLVNFGVVE